MRASARSKPLDEVWEIEYLPWGENRWGDYRLPANEGTPPVERRTFAFREGDDPAWQAAPVVPEDVQHPLVDLGFEDRMGQARGRPLPHERVLPDGWHEVVSTYGPKAVVDGRQLAEYSERLGVEDIVLSTPIGLKGWVEPVKVDLGESGGSVVSHGFVPAAADTHLVVEGAGVLTVWLDGTQLIGPVEGGVLSIPVHVSEGWHEVRIDVSPRHGVGGHLEGYRALPRTRLAWAFTEPYQRAPLGIWGGPVMHPDYKGAQDARRFRRRIVVSERAAVGVVWSAPGACTIAVPDVLEPGEHVIDAFVDGAIHPAGFACEVTLTMASGTVVIGTDDRWETIGAGEEWQRPLAIGMVGALSAGGGDPVFPEPLRRSPLLDVAWLEGEDSVAGHVETLWSDSPDAPPPAWFCFTAPPGAVSMTLPIVGEVSAWVDGVATSVDGDGGVLPLREHARVALRVQAPAGYRGAACFTSHPLLELGPSTMRVGASWHRLGLDCFSGVILHRTVVRADAGGPAVLDLGTVAGTVAVRVNGADAGTLTYGPWRLPVELAAGDNVIEVEVANTLGPMVCRGIPTPFGPEDQRFSGLLTIPTISLSTGTVPVERSVPRPHGITVPYAVSGGGPDGGRRMVFAHSLTGNGMQAAPLFQPLVDNGWQVAAMDQRGHGQATRITDPARLALGELADDYLAVLDDLGWDTAWFGGGSMGAATALAAAARSPHRVEGLALIAPAFGPTPNVGAAMFKEIADAFARSMDDGLAAWQQHLGDEHLDQLVPLGQDNLACLLATVPAWTLSLDFIAQLDVPVVVLAWQGDDIHPWSLAESITSSVARGALHHIGGTGPADLFSALAESLQT